MCADSHFIVLQLLLGSLQKAFWFPSYDVLSWGVRALNNRDDVRRHVLKLSEPEFDVKLIKNKWVSVSYNAPTFKCHSSFWRAVLSYKLFMNFIKNVLCIKIVVKSGEMKKPLVRSTRVWKNNIQLDIKIFTRFKWLGIAAIGLLIKTR